MLNANINYPYPVIREYAEDYQTTGCALAEYVSADCITDIRWTGGVVE